MNKEGRRLVEDLEEAGWSIFNENINGDEIGEYTYMGGRGDTVTDYVIGNEETQEKIDRLEIGENIDSDHHLVICWIRGEDKRGKREG
ncbi:hypothetical protein RF55_24505 [Lasius niger]|uniref:Uncharacterized protein n=1 Tax=Lasius niger TaxID=67767 RepID=A0A0J7JV14_LASNI|nr:hypothetical protein RF55_24505 [Lasius niger]